MRVPLSWLREHCDPDLDPEALAERLSMTGTEVERVTRVGVPSAEGFVVGHVRSAEQHPNADRLRVCTVDTGDDEPRTIVCGAPNVAAGQTVAVALPGAVMPGGAKLGTAKLRGVASAGMILSETELEIGDDSSGIAVLDEVGTAPGTPLVEVLPIADTVLELEITPNRPDCLGVFGVAREVHAISAAPLGEEPWEADAEPAGDDDVSDHASVRVEVPELCPRFTARAFADVSIGASPLWLKARLVAAGQRSINNVVDITNYVMLLTGQPLHAFDLDRVPGGEVIVRAAGEGERMMTLDDVERTLGPTTVVVADREGPSGIAGIMGGQVSEVSETTTRVLLEVANWNGTNVLRTSNALGLRSEASTRFEKGLHPDLTMRAQRVAARLMVELCGARLVPGTIDVDARLPELEPAAVSLRTERVRSLLGMEVTDGQIAGHLERLGFVVHGAGDGPLDVAVPPDRHFDITREIDLIEEIARVHGIDEHLPATLPERGSSVGGLERHGVLLRRLEDVLRDAGLDEAITWSFVAPDRGGVPGLAAVEPVRVHNPLSEEGTVMRTDLIGGLLAVAAHSVARGAEDIGVYESGRIYLPERPPAEGGVRGGRFAGARPAPVTEPHRIGCVLVGALRPRSWREVPSAADFYDAKGLVELLGAAMGVPVGFAPASRPFLHPARAASVSIAGAEAGWVGELHPAVVDRLGGRSGVAFEIDVEPLVADARAGTEDFEDVTTFPAAREDIAVVVPAGVPAGDVLEAVRAGGEPLLAEAKIFDLYEGEQLEAGTHSIAISMRFQADDRTLTDDEIATAKASILAELGPLGGSLRG